MLIEEHLLLATYIKFLEVELFHLTLSLDLYLNEFLMLSLLIPLSILLSPTLSSCPHPSPSSFSPVALITEMKTHSPRDTIGLCRDF